MRDVAYTPIQQQKPDLDPAMNAKISLQTALLTYGTRIQKSTFAFASIGANDMYTCPEGKVFFLYSLCLSGYGEDDISIPLHCFVELGLEAGATANQGILNMWAPNRNSAGDYAPFTVTSNFSIPVKVLPGEVLFLNPTTGNDSLFCCSMFGYEIDKSFLNIIA